MRSTREIGDFYEDQAADFLAARGYLILERKYRNEIGEIDIVAKDGDVLCFVEVKSSQTIDYDPLEAVTPRKQRQLVRMAYCYLKEMNFGRIDVDCRFDVVAVSDEEGIQLVQNAFDAG